MGNQNFFIFVVLLVLASFCMNYVNCQNFFYISQVEVGDRYRRAKGGLGYEDGRYNNSASLADRMTFLTTITVTIFACLTKMLYMG